MHQFAAVGPLATPDSLAAYLRECRELDLQSRSAGRISDISRRYAGESRWSEFVVRAIGDVVAEGGLPNNGTIHALILPQLSVDPAQFPMRCSASDASASEALGWLVYHSQVEYARRTAAMARAAGGFGLMTQSMVDQAYRTGSKLITEDGRTLEPKGHGNSILAFLFRSSSRYVAVDTVFARIEPKQPNSAQPTALPDVPGQMLLAS